MRNTLIIISIVAMAALAFVGYQMSPASDTNGQLDVVTSFYPLYFLASEIGGEHADVTNIAPAGVEPHDYEPTARDVGLIENSALFIVNGAGFEPWSERIIANLGDSVVVISAGGALANLGGEEHEHEEEEMHAEDAGNDDEEHLVDPHVWLSPSLALKMVDAILIGFVSVDPVHESEYRANAVALKSELTALDGSYRSGLSECVRKSIVTSHAAFGYVARDYGLEQMAISGVSPEEEPSPQELAEVAEFVRDNGITHIFFETLLSPKLSETIATETGASTLVLNPIEGLTDEELAQGKNYITVMEENLENLRIALQCR